jgi:hypothetical protein
MGIWDLRNVISISYGGGVADYQGCARAKELDTTTFVERTGKIGHPRGPVVFLLRYHISKIPNPHGPWANYTSRSFEKAKLLPPPSPLDGHNML